MAYQAALRSLDGLQKFARNFPICADFFAFSRGVKSIYCCY
jgi:hypothetical protein